MSGKGTITAQEIKNANGGGWILNVIMFTGFGEATSSRFVGFVDYEDAANFREMSDYFPSFNMIYLGIVSVRESEYDAQQHQRPGNHNGSLNGWDRLALAMEGN